MRITFLLSSAAAAALMITGAASANDQGKSGGKGKSSAVHAQKANKHDKGKSHQAVAGHSDRGAATAKKAARTAAARCPAGLAKKNNGCLAPGQAKKQFAQGDRLPAAFRVNNVPAAYAEQYRDTASALFRHSAGNVYRIDPATRRIADVIKLPSL